ncbi:MAG: nucleotidyltransferase family protein [Candidatus Bipolaricaulota bacterium]|nr:MAG: nucleotidyltransferase family protein [Candidatus Bipolaricaulota bacterium]
MVDAIVPAAGLGSRFGGIKPLMRCDGETAVARVVDALRAAGVDRVLVVVGHHATEVADAAQRAGAEVVANPDYECGLASSLVAGLRAAKDARDGILVLHADMPHVREETIRAVLDAGRRGASIARPVVDGRPGFPVFFADDHREALIGELHGDTGAREYIARHQEALVSIDVDDAGSVADVDVQETGSEGSTRGKIVRTA